MRRPLGRRGAVAFNAPQGIEVLLLFSVFFSFTFFSLFSSL
jgi:hypothetical protein